MAPARWRNDPGAGTPAIGALGDGWGAPGVAEGPAVPKVALVRITEVPDSKSRWRRNSDTSTGAAFSERFFWVLPVRSTQ